MIRVFIGYDRKEPVAFSTFAHSILRRSSEPVSIIPVALKNLENIFGRERNALQATDFSFSRFLVPYLCGFEGWAIFADCDQLMLADIADAWALRNDQYAVQVVKHDHVPTEKTKFLGQVQTTYPMKNWTSFMLMNCSKCFRLTPDYVNTATGLDLHRFNWLHDPSLIGSLPHEWNHLVGYDAPQGDEKNLHFTEGGPWFKDYEHVAFADLWRRERNAAFGIVPK